MRERLFLSPMAFFVLPGLTAVGSSLVLALLAGALALANGGDPWLWFAIGGAVGLAGGWFTSVLWVRSQLERERTAAADIAMKSETISLQVTQDDGTPYLAGAWLDAIPCDYVRLVSLAKSLADGEQFTVGDFSGPGQLFSRSRYYAVRKALLGEKLLEWVNPHPTGRNQGVQLTHAGEVIMRKLAEAE